MIRYCPAMLFDIHVHSDCSSCSRLCLADILDHALDRGLDGVCITDHHSLGVLDRIAQGRQPGGLMVFVGQEVDTRHGDFLVFGPVTPFAKNLSGPELLKRVRSLGGAAVAAHPFRKARPTAESVIREAHCHIVESVNGRNSDAENQRLDTWRRRYDLVECAGSDAHSLEELGRCKTRFNHPIHTLDDLIFALNQGLCSPDNSTSLPWQQDPHPFKAAAC